MQNQYLITKDENQNYVIASPVKSKKNPNSYTLKKICTLTSSLDDPCKNCKNCVDPLKSHKSTKKSLFTSSYILIIVCLALFFLIIYCIKFSYKNNTTINCSDLNLSSTQKQMYGCLEY
jgi:hypothetical protein